MREWLCCYEILNGLQLASCACDLLSTILVGCSRLFEIWSIFEKQLNKVIHASMIKCHCSFILQFFATLQALPVPPDVLSKMLGNRVAVSPIVTIEPRRRKFHKPITLFVPVPKAAQKGMLNQYGGDAPTLRLLCSIVGQWTILAIE